MFQKHIEPFRHKEFTNFRLHMPYPALHMPYPALRMPYPALHMPYPALLKLFMLNLVLSVSTEATGKF
jgi:hypothetical protein